MTTIEPTSVVGGDHLTSMRQAYETVVPELQALQPEELVQVNLDIPPAVSKIIGAWPRIHALRDQIQSDLPKFDLKRFDSLRTYALALGHTHSECALADQALEGLPALNEKLTRKRDIFLSIARTLVLWGLIEPERFAQIRGAIGYRVVAFELTGLSSLFRKEWAHIGPRSGLQLSDLDEADLLGTQMVAAVGVRDDGTTMLSEAAQMRQRAFTLFRHAYSDAQKAISHLRWEQDDADTIIPAIYPGRSRKSKVAPADPPVPPVVGPPVTPPVQGAPTGPAPTPAAPTPVVATTPQPPLGPSTPGGPGGSPFIS